MVLAVPLRILLLCLLHFCTFAVEQDVNPTVLMNIVNKFENQLGNMGQYAVAFRVEKDKCLKASDYPSQELLNKVKEKFQRNEVYVSDDLIAAKADKNKQDHSEFRLKNYLKNILNVKHKCVVYFTVNSPCLKKCLSFSKKFSVKRDLELLKKYKGIKAFAFKLVWREDNKTDVIKRLKSIALHLPYYQCEKNKAECDRL